MIIQMGLKEVVWWLKTSFKISRDCPFSMQVYMYMLTSYLRTICEGIIEDNMNILKFSVIYR